jgi:hypothetical protein
MTVRFALKRNGELIAPPRITYASPGVPTETRDLFFNAIMGSLHRCTPLPFTQGLGSEIAGVPILACRTWTAVTCWTACAPGRACR